MAYQPHTLVTFGGTLQEVSAGDEIWQCGIRGFGGGGGPVQQGDLAALALLILRGPTGNGGGLEGIWANNNGLIPNNAILKWCKAVNVGPDGKYTGEPGIAQGLNVAGQFAQSAPSFCTIALSWTTGKSLGRAVRGRMYPPNYAAVSGGGATISSSSRASILAWSTQMLMVLDTSLESVQFNPYIVSKYGVSNKITGSRVGNVWDTQRRRKDHVAESYVSASFTP